MEKASPTSMCRGPWPWTGSPPISIDCGAVRTCTSRATPFNQPGVEPEPLHIPAVPVVFLDGLFMLHDEGVRSRLDLSVLVHATPERRLARRMVRDQAERSLTPDIIQYQWDRHVRPGDLTYLEPVQHLADVVVDNDRDVPIDLTPALTAIESLLND